MKLFKVGSKFMSYPTPVSLSQEVIRAAHTLLEGAGPSKWSRGYIYIDQNCKNLAEKILRMRLKTGKGNYIFARNFCALDTTNGLSLWEPSDYSNDSGFLAQTVSNLLTEQSVLKTAAHPFKLDAKEVFWIFALKELAKSFAESDKAYVSAPTLGEWLTENDTELRKRFWDKSYELSSRRQKVHVSQMLHSSVLRYTSPVSHRVLAFSLEQVIDLYRKDGLERFSKPKKITNQKADKIVANMIRPSDAAVIRDLIYEFFHLDESVRTEAFEKLHAALPEEASLAMLKKTRVRKDRVQSILESRPFGMNLKQLMRGIESLRDKLELWEYFTFLRILQAKDSYVLTNNHAHIVQFLKLMTESDKYIPFLKSLLFESVHENAAPISVNSWVKFLKSLDNETFNAIEWGAVPLSLITGIFNRSDATFGSARPNPKGYDRIAKLLAEL